MTPSRKPSSRPESAPVPFLAVSADPAGDAERGLNVAEEADEVAVAHPHRARLSRSTTAASPSTTGAAETWHPLPSSSTTPPGPVGSHNPAVASELRLWD